MKKPITSVLIIILLAISSVYSQDNVKVGIVGSKISNFKLPTYQGKEFSMESLRGKNVLLISSRGKYADNAWCTICHYQYAEFADMELTQKISEKYNLEIVFLLPYGRDTMVSWEKTFPVEMAKVEKWKNPGNPDSLTQKQKDWMAFSKEHYPQKFDFTGKKVPLPLPVLMDTAQAVSKGLDLFRTEWGGRKAAQNIPAIYIIDKNGIIVFKYVSQNTTDRPKAGYVMEMIKKLL